jgi:hypothetical protein
MVRGLMEFYMARSLLFGSIVSIYIASVLLYSQL